MINQSNLNIAQTRWEMNSNRVGSKRWYPPGGEVGGRRGRVGFGVGLGGVGGAG